MNKIKFFIKKWICILLHKKKLKEFHDESGLFLYQMVRLNGCEKCDIWRVL